MAKKTITVVYKVDDRGLIKADQTIIKLGEDAAKASQQVDKIGDEGQKAGEKMSSAFASLKNIIATLGLVALAKHIFQVTAEFQKLEKVLANSLGSASEARASMNAITEFAAKTPFSVKELTASYVKLVNQGFRPTITQLRQLGDLAASTGKDFDQLTEAIIDAQTGEFERLKEFGIRAKKEGDNVTFTFKGVETQVKFTSQAIREYIAALGDAEGVSGSMAVISTTLSGKLANLLDAFDFLFNELGKIQAGPVADLIDGLTDLTNAAAGFLKVANMDGLDFAEFNLKRFREGVEEAKKALNEGKGFEKTNQIFMDLTAAINEATGELNALEEQMKADGDVGGDVQKRRELELATLKAEVQGYKDLRAQVMTYTKDYQANLKKIADAQAKLDAEEAQRILLMQARLAGQEYSKRAAEELNNQKNINMLVEGGEAIHTAIVKKENETRRDTINRIRKQIQDEQDQAYNEEYEKLKAQEERKRALYMATLDTVGQIANRLLEYREADTSDQEAKWEKELKMAGDNERRREEVQAKIDKERAKQQEKAKQEQRKAAIRQILVDTAVNVVRSIANNGGIPYGLPFGALALALGIAQVATVRKYKKGEIDIQGPGTGTSDSIPARLSKGESVITAERTKSSKRLLTMVRDGKINDKTMNKLRAPVQRQDNSDIVAAIENNKTDVVRIANDLYDVRASRSGQKTMTRRKYLS